MIDTYSIPHTVQVPYIHGAFLAVASQAEKVHCFVCIAHTSKCYTILMYLYLSFGETSITCTCRIPLSHTRVLMIDLYSRAGRIIVGGKVVTGGSREAVDFLAFWMSNSSMTTSAAIASTMGTARGTTQGSCLPRATSVPGVPSYWAVSCDCEMVAGDLKPILEKKVSTGCLLVMVLYFYRK